MAAFGKELASLGYGEAAAEALAMIITTDTLAAVRFTPDIVFDQTPGPRAGTVPARA